MILQRKPVGHRPRTKAEMPTQDEVMGPVPEGMTRYKVLKTLGAPDGKTYRQGTLVDLTDDEAVYYNELDAIGMHLRAGDTPDKVLPRKKVRTGKPAAPKALDDASLMAADPNAGKAAKVNTDNRKAADAK